MGGYDGIYSFQVSRDTVKCSEWYSLHVLLAGVMQIDGTPGIIVSLDNLVNAGCPGSLFSSSIIDPLKPYEGNVSNPHTPRQISPQHFTDEDGTQVHSYTMNARTDIEWGTPFRWNYDWVHACGRSLNDEQVLKLKEVHKTTSKHTKDIVKRLCQEVLDEGIYRDFIPSTRSFLPDGGGGCDDDDVSGSVQARRC